jgi:hypothetical protein
LTHIDFIKIHTAMVQEAGWLGETSTEIAGVEDLHPTAQMPTTITHTDSYATIQNPFSHSLTITATEDGIFSLYSVTGTLITQISVHPGEQTIDTSNLVSGIYIARIDSINQHFIYKLLKN